MFKKKKKKKLILEFCETTEKKKKKKVSEHCDTDVNASCHRERRDPRVTDTLSRKQWAWFFLSLFLNQERGERRRGRLIQSLDPVQYRRTAETEGEESEEEVGMRGDGCDLTWSVTMVTTEAGQREVGDGDGGLLHDSDPVLLRGSKEVNKVFQWERNSGSSLSCPPPTHTRTRQSLVFAWFKTVPSEQLHSEIWLVVDLRGEEPLVQIFLRVFECFTGSRFVTWTSGSAIGIGALL